MQGAVYADDAVLRRGPCPVGAAVGGGQADLRRNLIRVQVQAIERALSNSPISEGYEIKAPHD